MVDPRFPSMKARQLRRVIDRLGYEQSRKGSGGSHQRLTAEGRPPIIWAFHDGVTIAPGIVHSVLCKQVGLDTDEALALLSKKNR
ncbi:type II toxin-antitoxin system HicA family toxin [Patulibacter sp. S7RM1-6]